MKRLALTLSSLALLGAACGGRVGVNADDGGGGASNGKSGGTAGKSSSGSGGSSGPGTGIGGKTGGVPIGGSFAIGGASGVGGAVIWGGAGPDGIDECSLYCFAYGKVCPQAGLGPADECIQKCVASLQLDSAACGAGKRDAYECIGNALLQAGSDCNKALAVAKLQCGGATPQVEACNAS